MYYGEEPKAYRIVPTTTDNRGNGAVLDKLMTTRYPASAVLMELAAYSKKMGLKASVEWSPLEANREADALAIGDFSLFTPELRIPVSAQLLQWTILHQALDHGRVAEEARRAAKLVGLPERNRKRRRRRRPEERTLGDRCLAHFRFRHAHGHLHAASLSVCSRLRLSSICLSFAGLLSPITQHKACLLPDAVVPLFPLLCIVC